MKASNYIITTFLFFFIGTIVALHIDSKLYEPDYKKISKIRENYSQFYQSVSYAENLTPKQWNNFIDKAKIYNNEDNLYPQEITQQASIIYLHYRKFNDFNSLKLAANWCDLALKKEPKNNYLNGVYANVLFELDSVQKAIKHLKIAIKNTPDIAGISFYKSRLKEYEESLLDKKK